MGYQNTLACAITYTGVGLHSGRDVTITLQPAGVDTGVIFERTDRPEKPRVVARANNVTETLRATTLATKATKVFTVEHIMAALAGMQVDNCIVAMDSPEPPIGDGSALTFVELIQRAGIIAQDELCSVRVIEQAIGVYSGDKFITIQPYDGFRVTFTSVNPHPLLGVQFGDYDIDSAVFLQEIAAARTIGFMHEVEALKKMGLGLGGTLENVVVYDEKDVLTTLRYADELVRHKILDVIGDLALAGRLRGHVIAVKSGHALNTQLAKKIMEVGLVRGGV